MNDKLNRKIYANEIVEAINDKYNTEKELVRKDPRHNRENIVFAISGKWGEGKTGILDLMEKPLEDKGFKIIRFNPWKYSQQDITLKRAFLKQVRDSLRPRLKLDDLYHDKTSTNIDWGKIGIPSWLNTNNLIVGIIGLLLLLSLDSPGFNLSTAVINFVESIITLPLTALLLGALLLPLILKSITSERRSASVTTAEEFEDKFNHLIGDLKKIVIFIDDLDRCNPKTVKLILDSLKTFFIHPECSYVITGDHTIIERYAGDELQLDEKEYNSTKKLEEGRRFLKKLFDVYWRVPLPTPYQFTNFVKAEIKESKIHFPNESTLNNFTSLLTNDDFFGRNLRQTKRFITKLRFALESVRLQIKEIENELKAREKDGLSESKKSLEKILDNPDLLAKVLLVEEHFYPLYEWLVIHPEELVEQEKSLRNRLDSKQNIFDNRTSELLGKDNIELYETLVNSNPKFTNEDNSVVHEVADYFLFSGSTGLPSTLGPDESKFVEYIKSGNLTEKLGKILESGTTKDKNKQFAKKAIKIFDDSSVVKNTDPKAILAEQIEIISEVLKLSSLLDEWAEKLGDWVERFAKLPEENQNEIAKLLFEAILNKNPSLILEVKNNNPNLISILWDELASYDTKKWSKESKNVLFDLVKDSVKIDSLDLKSAEAYLSIDPPKKLDNEIIANLIDAETCKKYLEQLKSLNLSDKKLAPIIKDRMLELLEKIDQIDWIILNKEYLKELGILPEIQERLLNLHLRTDNLPKLISAKDQLELPDEIKSKLEAEVLNRIKARNFSLLENPEALPISKDTKKEIFKSLALLVAKRTSLEQRRRYCKLLSKSNVFWKGLETSDIDNELDKMSKENGKRNQKLKSDYDEILTSWDYAISSE